MAPGGSSSRTTQERKREIVWAREKETERERELVVIVMSWRPPEIAGTIGLPAGRTPVTAERVPIFYSAWDGRKKDRRKSEKKWGVLQPSSHPLWPSLVSSWCSGRAFVVVSSSWTIQRVEYTRMDRGSPATNDPEKEETLKGSEDRRTPRKKYIIIIVIIIIKKNKEPWKVEKEEEGPGKKRQRRLICRRASVWTSVFGILRVILCFVKKVG